jgi:D-alanine-D-alanine ligase
VKKLRVMALVREGLIPPDSLEGKTDKEIAKWKAEFDVIATLREMGHEVRPVAVIDDLGPIRETILDWKPHIVFMLLEEFHGVATYDYAISGYLELMRQPYTGCNPRGLLLSHDKALSKSILSHHRIRTPRFAVFPMGHSVRRTKRLTFPLFVKSATEHASLGIAQASIVRNDNALVERVRFIHESIGSDAIAEQYIEGREVYVGVMGNRRLKSLPPWELVFAKTPPEQPRIATAKAKWDPAYQERHGIETRAAAGLSEDTRKRLATISKRVYRSLHMTGYARMDMRIAEDGRIYVLEANANPNLEYGEDFSESADSDGISYEALLQRILNLGLSYWAPWRE